MHVEMYDMDMIMFMVVKEHGWCSGVKGGCARVQRSKGGQEGGLSPHFQLAWAQICSMLARCLIKRPQEFEVDQMAKYFMGEVPKLYDTHQYPWLAKWDLFCENPKIG